MEITEYDYHGFTLSITVATQRPEAAPSGILVAGKMHDEYAARVRALLREFRATDPSAGVKNLSALLTYYRITKMQPAGSAREVQGNYDLLRLQFSAEFTTIDAAQIGDERAVFAFERNIEKAVDDLFAANEIPNAFIPGEEGVLGDSYIQVLCTMGPALNQGAWNVAA